MASSHINRLVSLIFTTGRLIRERASGVKQSPHLSLLHLDVLRYVKERKNPLMREVANYVCIQPPSATVLINGLVASKYLKRSVDAKDRRAVHLRLTPAGRLALRSGFTRTAKRWEEIFGHLTAQDQGELIRILQKISDAYRRRAKTNA